MRQFIRETEDCTNKYLFQSYHRVGYEHLLERHLDIPVKVLQKRLAPIPFDAGNIQHMTRFNKGTTVEEVLEMIRDCLLANEEEIMKHLKRKSVAKEFTLCFDHKIGEGLVKGADPKKLISMSGIGIAVGPSDHNGRLFEIISVYCIPNIDEIDDCWDAIEEWQSK